MQMETSTIRNEIKKNEIIKTSIEASFEAAAKQRQTLCTILLKLFETTQDRVFQLSQKVSKMTGELEGNSKFTRS